jgi:DNA-binding helix-hairpin-helix protein with protein kinase domain
MARTLFTAKGAVVEIGRELGRGGEGSVFEVPSLGSQVAKLYHAHKQPDTKKQAKLTFMAATADQQLLSYLAWPQETLHPSRGGPVVGFLMPKVAGKEPIHMVYSPAHRRLDHPKASWDFLLFVARNIAACFETVHKHGHVIGDVNQDSVMAGKDSRVMIIDTDSFQINSRGTMHLCEVGVLHFTPPELQSLKSFDGFTRTTNHDNFGLALLIFHVLFGARHPYSGVPLKSGIGDALETDITNFRYAYARDSQSRGIAPPPRSIPLSLVPDAMEAMFLAAFTERGAQGGRPTAQQWVAALDSVRGHLKKCSTSSMHIYPDHLAKCPWCSLEQQGVAYFIDLRTTFTQTATGFMLTQVWAIIQALPAPPSLSVPSPSSFTVTAQALPSGVPGEGTITFYRLLAVGIGIAVAMAAPKVMFWGFVVGLVGWFVAGSAGSSERAAERSRRTAIRQAAKKEYDELVERAQRDAGPAGFQAKRAELSKLRDEYQALPQAEKQELDKLHSTAQERQKQKFLDTCFIDSASISGVGPARKAALRSFGIETAADVSRNMVMQVRGFGEGLTRAVMDWKASCERRFVFNAANAVSAADRNAVRSKFGARKVSIEGALGRGAGELQNFRQRATSQMATLQPQLEAAARKFAQSEKDLSVF